MSWERAGHPDLPMEWRYRVADHRDAVLTYHANRDTHSPPHNTPHRRGKWRWRATVGTPHGVQRPNVERAQRTLGSCEMVEQWPGGGTCARGGRSFRNWSADRGGCRQ